MYLFGTARRAALELSTSNSTKSVACSAVCMLDDDSTVTCNCVSVYALVEERLGESLEDVLQRERGVIGCKDSDSPLGGSLSMEQWLFYCTSMLDAVSGLHKRCVVHGDVKLANFCLADTGEAGSSVIKIIDMGETLN